MKGRVCLLFTPLFLFATKINSQVNFVQNPSFEKFISCPTNFSEIYLCEFWDTLRVTGGCGPDFYHACTSNTNLGVPYNGYSSFQYPRTGDGIAQLSCYYPSTSFPKREYIQNELRSKLISGKKYCLTFYLSLQNESTYAITEIGGYLDNGNVATSTCGTLTLTPQVKSVPGVFLADTLGWMKVQGAFTAQGNEGYLTLGNFKLNASTSFSVKGGGSRLVADYYVDDVSVLEADLKAYAGPDTVLCLGDSVFIGRPPEIGLECQWFSNSVNIANTGGFWIKPAATQTFAVSQDVCGVITFDTIQVQIKPKYTDATTLTANYVSLCPNDSLKLQLLSPPTDFDTKLQWQGPGLNSYTIANPSGVLNQTSTYSINYSSLGAGIHCPYNYNRSISIELRDTCEMGPVFPNIFTPNGDGANDVWGINYNSVKQVKQIYYAIYDRWGILMFESSQPKKGWDGYTTSGIQCSDGVYFFIAKIKDTKDQIKEYKGNITLVR